jgi:hypothetical protein
MNHRIGRLLFAFGIGLIVAVAAFKWITNPAPRLERQLQEAVVMTAREHLATATGLAGLEIVDPVAPDRKVGKSYVFRAGEGWEVSGHYRRSEEDRWHPFLMALDASPSMTHLRLQDGSLADRARENELLELLP